MNLILSSCAIVVTACLLAPTAHAMAFTPSHKDQPRITDDNGDPSTTPIIHLHDLPKPIIADVAALDELQIEDAQLFASEHGISLETAKDMLYGQNEFNELTERAMKILGEYFVEANWNGLYSSQSVIFIKIGTPQSLKSPIKLPIREVDDLTPSQVKTISDSASSAVKAGQGGYDLLVFPETRKVQVHLSPPTLRASASALVDQINKGITSTGIPVDVSYTKSNQISEQTYGGGGNWLGEHCTTGWVIRNGKGYGITTARHCEPAGSYDGANVNYLIGASDWKIGDISLYSLSGGEPRPKFRRDWGRDYNVNQTGVAVKGSTICKFGINTGKSCGEIVNWNASYRDPDLPSSIGNLLYGSIRTNKGDSGGPLYAMRSAIGMTSGRRGDKFGYFTKVGIIEHVDRGYHLYTTKG